MLSTRTVRSGIKRVKEAGVKLGISEALAEQYRQEAVKMGVSIAVSPNPQHPGMCVVWGGCPKQDRISIAGRLYHVTTQETAQGTQYILHGSRGATYGTMRYPSGTMYLVNQSGHVDPLGRIILTDTGGVLRQA